VIVNFTRPARCDAGAIVVFEAELEAGEADEQ
jgi:hypothetical protein